jgi:hypothetical protein
LEQQSKLENTLHGQEFGLVGQEPTPSGPQAWRATANCLYMTILLLWVVNAKSEGNNQPATATDRWRQELACEKPNPSGSPGALI